MLCPVFPTEDPRLVLQEVMEEGFESAASDGTDFHSNLGTLRGKVRDRWKIILITQLLQRHPPEISGN